MLKRVEPKLSEQASQSDQGQANNRSWIRAFHTLHERDPKRLGFGAASGIVRRINVQVFVDCSVRQCPENAGRRHFDGSNLMVSRHRHGAVKNNRLPRKCSELALRIGVVARLAQWCAMQRGRLVGANHNMPRVLGCDDLRFGLRKAQRKCARPLARRWRFIHVG